MGSVPRSASRKNLLLTGLPGIGKTTAIIRLTGILRDRRIAGFYTQEIREGKRRQGFRVTTFSGRTAILAGVDLPSRFYVGRYGVDVAAFEKTVLEELTKPCDLMLIDEIGKMECISSLFLAAVRGLLDGPTSIVATIAASGRGFISEVKGRADVETILVTHSNRDLLPQRLAERFGAGA